MKGAVLYVSDKTKVYCIVVYLNLVGNYYLQSADDSESEVIDLTGSTTQGGLTNTSTTSPLTLIGSISVNKLIFLNQ